MRTTLRAQHLARASDLGARRVLAAAVVLHVVAGVAVLGAVEARAA